MRVPYFPQQELYTCGAAATRMVLKYYGIKKSEKELKFALKTTLRGGTKFSDVRTYIKTIGLKCIIRRNIRPEKKGLQKLQKYLAHRIPIIVTVNRFVYDKRTPRIYQKVRWESKIYSYHIIVLTEIDKENVYFNDPHLAVKKHKIPIQQFIKAWYDKKYPGYMVVIRN